MATHVLDYSEIDALDEISGDEQYALAWCNTHIKGSGTGLLET